MFFCPKWFCWLSRFSGTERPDHHPDKPTSCSHLDRFCYCIVSRNLCDNLAVQDVRFMLSVAPSISGFSNAACLQLPHGCLDSWFTQWHNTYSPPAVRILTDFTVVLCIVDQNHQIATVHATVLAKHVKTSIYLSTTDLCAENCRCL